MKSEASLDARMREAEERARLCAADPTLAMCRGYAPRPSLQAAEQGLGLDEPAPVAGPPGHTEWLEAIAKRDLPRGSWVLMQGGEEPFLAPV